MNSNFTKEKIEKLADLLMIGLSDDEANMVLDEFEIIDANINKINEIENISEVEESVDIKDLLQNCDDTDDREISVPKVVG